MRGSPRKKPSEILLERIRTELDFDLRDGCKIRRTYAGKWQLGAGEWSWFVEGTPTNVGGCETVKRLARSKNLSVFHRGPYFEITCPTEYELRLQREGGAK